MDALNVGSVAPPLRGAKWLQGDPVTEFIPNHLYVVEFWATWCGPCRATIPKLSQVAAKFEGKATMIGVDVFEQDQGSPESIALVEEFVAKMGSKMTYRVLIDGKDRFMAEEWMKRSGRQGIPSAFIVDGEGKIAWIGHPGEGLERILNAILDGTYVAEPTNEPGDKKIMMAKVQKDLAAYLNFLEDKDYEGAVREAERLASESDQFSRALSTFKFQAAAVCGLSDIVREMLDGFAEDPEQSGALPHLVSILSRAVGLSQDIYERAIRIQVSFLNDLEEGMRPYKGMFLDPLAHLYAHIGNLDAAINTEKEAIEEWRKRGDDSKFVSMCERQLEEWESARLSGA